MTATGRRSQFYERYLPHAAHHSRSQQAFFGDVVRFIVTLLWAARVDRSSDSWLAFHRSHIRRALCGIFLQRPNTALNYEIVPFHPLFEWRGKSSFHDRDVLFLDVSIAKRLRKESCGPLCFGHHHNARYGNIEAAHDSDKRRRRSFVGAAMLPSPCVETLLVCRHMGGSEPCRFINNNQLRIFKEDSNR